MKDMLRAIVPCRIGFRDGVSALIESLCAGIDSTTMFQIVSAFNEAFNNVVQHSTLAGDASVEVQATRDARQVEVRILDGGVRYQLPALLEQDEPVLVERGMGFQIIHRCMDEVRYEHGGANDASARSLNVLSMVRYLQAHTA